jgi:ABC-type glycerol-3-phosphate transport system substrate-binding protein
MLLLLFFVGALNAHAQPGNEAHPERPIRVDLNVYTPGMVPAGIGEPVKEAGLLAKEWEALHPGKQIKFQPVVSAGGGEGEWVKTQLLGGIAPEILHQNAEVCWQDFDKGWYVPLDEFLEKPNPYVPGNRRWIEVFENQELVRTKRAPDGKLYCISIDIIETGLFYNKDLLRKLGFDRMPETWVEMLDMFRKIKAQGVTPMTTAVFGLGSDWGQDIILEMLYHNILPDMDLVPSSTDTASYVMHFLEPPEAGFLASKGFFSSRDPRWREVNRLVYEWRQFWPRELKNADPARQFLTGRSPIFWDSAYVLRRMATDPYVDFEWGVAYIPTLTTATSRFASGTPATVIGGAAIQLHITNSALINKNLEDCVDFLMFLTTPRAIERMASEALIFIPNIKGAKMAPELQPFYEIFQRHTNAIQFLESLDGRFKKQWRRMLDFYLNDGLSLDEYLKVLDQNFQAWVDSHRGEPAWDFTDMEKKWDQRKARLLAELN